MKYFLYYTPYCKKKKAPQNGTLFKKYSGFYSLAFNKFSKKTFFCNKFVICSVFNYFSAIENDDTVALTNGGKSVCYNESCAFKAIKRFGNFFLSNIDL